MDLYCCKAQPKKAAGKRNGKAITILLCEKCGRRGEGPTQTAAEAAFNAWKKPGANTGPQKPAADKLPLATIPGFPTTPAELPTYVTQHLAEITAMSAAFIERPALAQMVKRNVRYVMTMKDERFLKLWTTPEGQESIVRALEDAFSYGATLPQMGSIVTFGPVCEFIPAVEAFEFALTEGRAAPFAWIRIEVLYENDQYTVSRKNGNFEIDVKSMTADRSNPKAIAVYGKLSSRDQIIGELYDAERILDKAKVHSEGYKAYMRSLYAFERARTEGNVKTDAEGREYADVQVEAKNADKYAEQNRQNFEAAEKAGTLKKDGRGEYAEVQLPKKNSTETWTKKIYRAEIDNPGTEIRRLYREDLVNPYDGPDLPEMLRKSAGKTFLGPYAKVRNSVAAMADARKDPETVEDALDAALDSALKQFEGGTADAEPADYTVEGEEGEPGEERWTREDWQKGKRAADAQGTKTPTKDVPPPQGGTAASASSPNAQSRPAAETETKKGEGKEGDVKKTLF